MPVPTQTLTPKSARRTISERSFHGPTGHKVGVELEWFTTPSDDPPRVRDLQDLLGDVTLSGSKLSFEPGAQVELSTDPLYLEGACDAAARDTETVRRRLASHAIELFASGVDPNRSLGLRTDNDRYVAMRRYFDAYGPAGGRMMCATASIHINLDAGSDDEGHRRWHAAHAMGPTLVAAFANSALVDGVASGWKSSRFDALRVIDPTRTRPVPQDADPAGAWADYALDARVMFIRTPDGCVPLSEPMTMRDWVVEGHPLGYPSDDDLAYHLTTLFPPVRPRGWIELRMIDMLPDPWWRVAVVVATTLVCDPVARERALEACIGTEGHWDLAARCGAEDSGLLTSTQACFTIALDALASSGCDASTLAAVRNYEERYISHGRCPADDQLTLELR